MVFDVIYRQATVDDAATLARLRWEFRLEESAGSALHSQAEFLLVCTDFIATGIADGSWVYWVADAAGSIVSQICIQIVRKIPKPNRLHDYFGYVTNVYTQAAYRNRGIGAELMQHVIKWAQEYELENLIVWPSERSVPFYQRAGFSHDPEVLQREIRPYVL